MARGRLVLLPLLFLTKSSEKQIKINMLSLNPYGAGGSLYCFMKLFHKEYYYFLVYPPKNSVYLDNQINTLFCTLPYCKTYPPWKSSASVLMYCFSFAPRGLQRPPSRLSAVLSTMALARVCPLYIFMHVCASVL